MSWRERTRPASWRGIAFEMESVDTETGVRGEDYQYPGSNRTYAEPAGTAPLRIQFTAWIAGDDHDLFAAQLVGAMGEASPGELVHPLFGPLIGVCRSGRVSHSRTEGGVSRIDITFTQSGEPLFPAADVLTLDAIDVSSAAVDAAAVSEFESAWSVSGESAHVLDSARRSLQSLTTKMQTSIGGPLGGELALAAAAVGAVARLAQEASELADDPAGEIAERIVEAVQLLDVIGALRGLFGASASAAPTAGLSAEERTARANDEAAARLLERVALAQAGRVVAGTDLALYDEAVALRDELSDRMADEARTDPAIAGPMIDLRGRVVEDINARLADTARIVTVPVRATTSTIELAWKHYGDPTRCDEIAELNEIAHGGFVTADVRMLSR